MSENELSPTNSGLSVGKGVVMIEFKRDDGGDICLFTDDRDKFGFSSTTCHLLGNETAIRLHGELSELLKIKNNKSQVGNGPAMTALVDRLTTGRRCIRNGKYLISGTLNGVEYDGFGNAYLFTDEQCESLDRLGYDVEPSFGEWDDL